MSQGIGCHSSAVMEIVSPSQANSRRSLAAYSGMPNYQDNHADALQNKCAPLPQACPGWPQNHQPLNGARLLSVRSWPLVGNFWSDPPWLFRGPICRPARTVCHRGKSDHGIPNACNGLALRSPRSQQDWRGGSVGLSQTERTLPRHRVADKATNLIQRTRRTALHSVSLI